MLDMIRNSISQAPEAAALFYDELARIIQLGGIDPKIEVEPPPRQHIDSKVLEIVSKF